MYVRISATIVFLFSILAPFGNTLLAVQWCGCGYCYMASTGQCSCSYPYIWCLEDFDPMQLRALPENHPMNVASIPERETSTIHKTDVTERVTALMTGGKCLHDKVTLSMFGKNAEDLKFVPVDFDERNVLAFVSETNSNK